MKLIVLAFIMLTSVAYAENHETFEQAKANAISGIDKHIEILNTHKGCISAAQDKEALKKCREAMKAARAEFRDARKENRSRRQNLREERRAKKKQ